MLVGAQSNVKPHVEDISSARALALSAILRHRDNYTFATGIGNIGGIVKIVGIVISVLSILIGLAGGLAGLIGAFSGVLTGVPVYLLGVLISAVGRQIGVSTDTAVHTSPFLSDSEKASVMSLDR
jgi:hypothetical protein